MGLPSSGRGGRRARLALALVALFAAAVAALLYPPLALLAIAAAAAIVLWDQAARAEELRSLAAMVTSVEPDAKLEVAEGAWGELCHALNRLLQQRRTEIQIRRMLPTLPGGGAARLADLSLPPDGLTCDIVVLALAIPSTASTPVARLRDTAYAALHQAQLHDAILARWGEGLLLIFGALGTPSDTAALRGAYQAARALAAAWSASHTAAPPHLTLAGGAGRVLLLPGLGLTVIGAPLEQAIALQRLGPGGQILCNEDAYLGLRRLGFAPPQPAARRPLGDDQAPAFAVPI